MVKKADKDKTIEMPIPPTNLAAMVKISRQGQN
jgi:hypothetical protein